MMDSIWAIPLVAEFVFMWDTVPERERTEADASAGCHGRGVVAVMDDLGITAPCRLDRREMAGRLSVICWRLGRLLVVVDWTLLVAHGEEGADSHTADGSVAVAKAGCDLGAGAMLLLDLDTGCWPTKAAADRQWLSPRLWVGAAQIADWGTGADVKRWIGIGMGVGCRRCPPSTLFVSLLASDDMEDDSMKEAADGCYQSLKGSAVAWILPSSTPAGWTMNLVIRPLSGLAAWCRRSPAPICCSRWVTDRLFVADFLEGSDQFIGPSPEVGRTTTPLGKMEHRISVLQRCTDNCTHAVY
ncbi:hypothetical protein ACLOJK_037063 [Asimina triloba]